VVRSRSDKGSSDLADIEQRLRGFDVTAVLVRQAARTIIEVGDVSCPVHIHSMRKSILSTLFGQAHDRGEIDLNVTLGELEIDDTPRLTDEEKSARVEDLLAARSGVYLPTEEGVASGRPSEDCTRPARSGVTTIGISTFWETSMNASSGAVCSSPSSTI
jgi:hypothetical protein